MAVSTLRVRTAAGTWTALNSVGVLPAPPNPSDPRGVTIPFHGRYRGAHNTGVPDMSALKTPILGRVFNTASQTYNDEHFIGSCGISAAGIVFNRCYFESRAGGGLFGVYSDTIPVQLNDCSLNGSRSISTTAVVSGQVNLTRCHLWGSGEHSFDIGPNTVCQDSYLHGVYPSFGSHADAFQTQGGNNQTVLRSKLLAYLPYSTIYHYSGCMQFGTYQILCDNCQIIDNFIDGGALAISGNMVGNPLVTNNAITGNRFGRNSVFNPPVSSSCRITPPNGTFTNNVYDDTGLSV